MVKRVLIIVWISLLFIFVMGKADDIYGRTYAEADTDMAEKISDYDFRNIEEVLDGESIDFADMVERLATGESEGVFYELFSGITEKLFGDMSYNKTAIVKIIIIAVVSSLFSNISIILKKSEMSETGFYITYMLLITILMGSFVVISNVVISALGRIVEFMNALIPAFSLSLGMSGETMTAMGFSQILLVAISIIEKILLNILLPMVNVYVIILLVNNIVSEDYFSKFADVIKMLITWALKGFMTVLLGADIIQGMILPSVDGAKKGIVNKIINIIPGGSTITNAEGIITSTASVIKNAIGGAGLIAIILITAFPMLKMLIYTIMYRLTGAIVQPISDKRIGAGIDAVSEGIMLLYKVMFTVTLLFFITIAVVCFATNINC